MKNIILLTDGWRRYLSYVWIEGVMARAKEKGIDIILSTFNTNGNLSHDKKHNMGEYAIYDVPQFDKCDGVILDCTNIKDHMVIQHIIDRIKEASVPAVSISYYVKDFYYVGVDNKKLFRQIMDHMYYEHNCRNIVFAGGPDYSYENIMRFQAYCAALQDYGIPVVDENCLFGDFDYDTGVRYIKEWVEKGRKLPDAFVCANDNIAAGMCYEAERMGLPVPGFFKVTGYDNFDKAAYYRPQITTAAYERNDIGRLAFDVLSSVWSGEEVDTFNYIDARLITAESCGCVNNGMVDYRGFAKNQVDWSVAVDRHEETVMEFESRIEECRTFTSLFEVFGQYTARLDCDGCFICIDKPLIEADINRSLNWDRLSDENFLVVYAEDNGKRIYSIGNNQEYSEYLNNQVESQNYVFFPIHFRDVIVGTTMIKNPRFLHDNPIFFDVNTAFAQRLENLYRHLQLANASKKMEELFNKDPLTHLYNRLAYSQMIKERFRKYVNLGVSCALVFFDVDRFKEINDTLGHDFGDKVLIAIAETINHYKPLDGLVYRFGGDEFVVFVPYALDSKIKRFTDSAVAFLEKMGIYISCGVIVTDPKAPLSLEEYIVMADKKMYDVKRQRKKEYRKKLVMRVKGIKPSLSDAALFSDKEFLKGVDISGLLYRQREGVEFLDANGNKVEPFDFLRSNNINAARISIFVNPELDFDKTKGSCGIDDTLEVAKKIKECGMSFLLDIQYSDSHAIPGDQNKPKAWERLSFEELKDKVYDYTVEVLNSLSAIDALPDIVQIGNEIRSGLIFPDGALPRYDRMAELVNSGIRAVRYVSEDIKVMIHLDHGGRFYCLKEWFDAMYGSGMEPIDCIGISFYTFWHGTFMDLKNTITQLIKSYNLPVYVVETAHPWRHCSGERVSQQQMKNTGFKAGIIEQKKVIELVMQIAVQTAGDRSSGVFYYEPMSIPDMGFGSWDANMGMFDENGMALYGWEAYKKYNPYKSQIDDLDTYMNSLYDSIEAENVIIGENIIENGDFAQGLNTWWPIKSPADIKVEERENEIFFSAEFDFKFTLFKEMRIEKAGKYRFMVSYRGSSSENTDIELFLKAIEYSGEENHIKKISPSDIRFVTYYMEDVYLPVGQISLGIRVCSSAAYGRIMNMRLIEVED